MHLDVYRTCSWREKRDVLGVFWSSSAEPTERLGTAAVQYGYYTLLLLAVIVLELAFIFVVALNHHSFVTWLAALAELFVLWSTWWALRRYRVLRSRFGN